MFISQNPKEKHDFREKIEKLCYVTYARKQNNNATLYTFKLSFWYILLRR